MKYIKKFFVEWFSSCIFIFVYLGVQYKYILLLMHNFSYKVEFNHLPTIQIFRNKKTMMAKNFKKK